MATYRARGRNTGRWPFQLLLCRWPAEPLGVGTKSGEDLLGFPAGVVDAHLGCFEQPIPATEHDRTNLAGGQAGNSASQRLEPPKRMGLQSATVGVRRSSRTHMWTASITSSLLQRIGLPRRVAQMWQSFAVPTTGPPQSPHGRARRYRLTVSGWTPRTSAMERLLSPAMCILMAASTRSATLPSGPAG
jgi:hypothetical protein